MNGTSDTKVPEGLLSECTDGKTLGEAAGCYASKGYDVKIEGGLAYLNCKPWDALNEWEAAKP